MDALKDQRPAGNARKLVPEQEELVRGILTYNRHRAEKSLQQELLRSWEIELAQSRIDQLRRKYKLDEHSTTNYPTRNGSVCWY